MKLYEQTAEQLLQYYQNKRISPVEVIRSLFKRINQVNPKLNALVTLNQEEAQKRARGSELRWMNGTARPLEGIPVAIKDLTNTEGLRTTYGSLVYKNNIPKRDAGIVTRLKQAGAIIIGKTNTPEFGHKAATNNRVFGPTRNPWNLENGVGGSSGGSAAAVAAGLTPLAEGSDGGGSIRIPSASCGVFGFKPTFGRVSGDNHLDQAFSDTVPFISYGPIARTVSDAALMFDTVQGSSPNDPFSLDKLEQSAYQTLREPRKQPFRIGYTLDFGMYTVDSKISEIFFQTLDHFREWGAVVEPADIHMKKNLREFVSYFNRLWMIGLAVRSKNLMEKHENELSESLISMIHRGEAASAEEYIEMNGYRTYLWKMFQQQFEHYDVIVSPTLAQVSYRFDEEGPIEVNGHPINPESDWMMTSPINLTGQPACSLPIGFNASGLPVGMQCIAKRLDDLGLFQFAKWAEEKLGVKTLAEPAE